MAGERTVPPAAGARTSWWEAPERLRRAVEDLLGGRVAEAVTQPGGFSPGVAARLRLADGRRAFVKAAGAEPNPETPELHRAEARVAATLPPAATVPAFHGAVDQGDWVALAFEDIDGRPPREPWEAGELRRVLDALAALAATMTPAPVEAPTAAERWTEQFRGWRRLAGSTGVDDLDPWVLDRLDRLAAVEATWEDASAGATLVHADIRADNLLLTPDRVVVVDWPWACLAPPWFDLLLALPCVRMQGGPPPQEVFDAHPVAAGADGDAVTAVLAAVTGFFVHMARLPAPPGLPTLRAFQRAQGDIALDWLRRRLDGRP
ncbi:phosphotransferase family protein [Actinomadura kijaniata]|uniref:phosphotransferase family protein n=1 Tax=Actinomadura kijaniata TaxID=46161 RepID=UPI00082BFC79|nr:phosphotransferase [Actinomadura kijaniata]